MKKIDIVVHINELIDNDYVFKIGDFHGVVKHYLRPKEKY